MKPLAHDTDVTFESWISSTPYTLARKNELREILKECGLDLYMIIPDKYLWIKAFVKDEHYDTFKHARAINSRHDVFKCLVGPIYQKISDQLFSLPWFIKKIPIKDRPQYILDLLYRVGHHYFISDYTSFEAHFTKEMMEDCEMELADYMTSELPEHTAFMDLIRRAKMGTNHINFKNWSCEIEAKRMSGEMDTSLSNGFSNLMFMLYLCEEAGLTDISGVIEGDDGLFVFKGDHTVLNTKVFSDFGLSIKLEKVEDLNHASFCGMVFDLDDKTNITDPITELVSFGWTTARYSKSRPGIHKCLIRAKALSLAYQYPACPILTKLAYKMCQLTAGVNSMNFVEKQGSAAFSLYEVEMVRKSHEYFNKNDLLKSPGKNTRILVEQLYGVTVADQLALEDYIDSITTIGPIESPIILNYTKPEWHQYYDDHSFRINRRKHFDVTGLIFRNVRKPADVSLFMS
jgi:hypothetical protein